MVTLITRKCSMEFVQNEDNSAGTGINGVRLKKFWFLLRNSYHHINAGMKFFQMDIIPRDNFM